MLRPICRVLFLLALLWPGMGWAAAAIGATKSAATGSATSVTTAAITTQASGSTIVVYFCWSSTTFTSITDSKSNSWTQIGTELSLAGGQKSRAYYVANATGGASHTFTVTIGASQPISVWVIEVTGVPTSGVLDQANRQSDSTSAFTSPGVTTTQANELLLGFHSSEGLGGSYSHTAGNSFTKITADEITDGDSFYPGISMYQYVTSTGTYNTSTTLTSGSPTDSANWIMAFDEGSGGGASIRTLSLLGVGQ